MHVRVLLRLQRRETSIKLPAASLTIHSTILDAQIHDMHTALRYVQRSTPMAPRCAVQFSPKVVSSTVLSSIQECHRRCQWQRRWIHAVQ